MEFKAKILEEEQVKRSLARIAHEIIEKNNGADKICLLGIKRRGIPLAYALQENIEKFSGKKAACGSLDISLYRDDLTEAYSVPKASAVDIPVDIKDYTIIIVDDVLYTGRTVRAAIEAIFQEGRPKAIQLAVLIDRGHRELPIRPDYVGKNIPTAQNEVVKVLLEDYDDETGVSIYQIED